MVSSKQKPQEGGFGMDDDPRKRSIKELGFDKWLDNVFWPYYKWYFFLGLAVLTILVLSVISLATRERADLVLTYVYSTAPDEAQMEKARELFAAKAKTESGRGTVKVKVEAFPLVNEQGERLLYGELEDADRIIYILDDASVSFYQTLGYFGMTKGVLPGTELFAAVRDTPVIPYRLEDFADQGYTQEQIDESNAYREEEHRKQVQAANELVLAVIYG